MPKTSTLATKEYCDLIFANRPVVKINPPSKNKIFNFSAFGVLRKGFGKADSKNIVKKLRATWRE